MTPAEYRDNRTSYRIAEAVNALFLKYPRKSVAKLLGEILGNEGDWRYLSDGRFVRRINERLEE